MLANHAQPYPTSQYSIFVAEIASTLNETLLLDHMLKVATSDSEKLYYLGSALENLRQGVPAMKAAERNNPYCEWIGADIRSDLPDGNGGLRRCNRGGRFISS